MDRIDIFENYILNSDKQYILSTDGDIIVYELCHYGEQRYGYVFYLNEKAILRRKKSYTIEDTSGNTVRVFESGRNQELNIHIKVNIPSNIGGIPVIESEDWLQIDWAWMVYPHDIGEIVIDLSNSDLSNIIKIDFMDDLAYIRGKVKLILPDGDRKLRPVSCFGLMTCLKNSAEVFSRVDYSYVLVGSYMFEGMYRDKNCRIELNSIKLPNIKIAQCILLGQDRFAIDSDVGSFVEMVTYTAENVQYMFGGWGSTLFMDFKPFKIYVRGKHGDNVLSIFSGTNCEIINLANTEFIFDESVESFSLSSMFNEYEGGVDKNLTYVVADFKFKNDMAFIEMFDNVIVVDNLTKEDVDLCILKSKAMNPYKSLLILSNKI